MVPGEGWKTPLDPSFLPLANGWPLLMGRPGLVACLLKCKQIPFWVVSYDVLNMFYPSAVWSGAQRGPSLGEM